MSMGGGTESRHRCCFVAVAEAETLKVAAELKLHTSQPSLSRQIWVLEDEVGAQLLTRGARGIELTPARRYVKLGFGGEHTDSNQRLMYTSA
jgi:LysR family transcriptional regulator, hca operon transcriptional activator